MIVGQLAFVVVVEKREKSVMKEDLGQDMCDSLKRRDLAKTCAFYLELKNQMLYLYSVVLLFFV